MNTIQAEKLTDDPTDAVPDGESGVVYSSAAQKQSPHLSHRSLTYMLLVMCLVPVLTITALWQYLPAVYEGKLEANAYAEGLPGPVFYEEEFYARPPFEGGVLVVENLSDQDWTLLNIRVNGRYQVYDREPIPAHGERRYELNRFVNRSGARFSLRYNELKRVRVYARRPTKDRATYYREF